MSGSGCLDNKKKRGNRELHLHLQRSVAHALPSLQLPVFPALPLQPAQLPVAIVDTIALMQERPTVTVR